MASREIEPTRPKKIRRNFVSALVSAFLEWFLILFLFIDAVISYVITKFARGCKLQTPCLLCSRLDHVLGKEKMGYYWDLMCRNHKSEISSLVLCHAHNQLVDVHKMCENCLFSFATINKSNAETYRLLVGKLGEDLNSDFDQDSCLVDDQKISDMSRRNCACCSQPWVPRGHTHAKELIQTRFVASEAAEFEMPLSGAIEHDHKVMMTGRDRSLSLTAAHSTKGGLDPLSHIGYTELKITSDTESEALPSDDEDGASARAVTHERDDHKHEFSVRCTESQIVTLDDDLASVKLLDPASGPKPSLLEPQGKEEETIEPFDCKPQESAAGIGHGFEELNWQEVRNEIDIIPTPAETTIHSASPLDAIEAPVELPQNSSNVIILNSEVEQTSVVKSECGEVLERGPPANTTAETGLETNAVASDGGQQVINSLDLGDAYKLAVDNRELLEREPPANATAETDLETNTIASDGGQQATNSLDLGDAYKLAVDNRVKQYSGSLADQWLGKDSTRVTEDLKVLLSQLSANRGFELPINDISPKLSVNSDDLKTLDPSSSIGMQILQKRISLERNESGLSLDGSIISEIEGESLVDRLKRQVEHDKKIMTALYKELEEERNASAVATNQAMAMITRLQEEKAALHMEALQYLRMMEEQAEYDDDELQKSNDLLAEKEKELQDLEAELDCYKKKFPNERFQEDLSETSGSMRVTDIGVDNSEYSCIRDGAIVSVHPILARSYNNYDKNVDKGNLSSSILEFEDERAYILQCLKKLEKTFDLLSDDEVSSNLSKDDCSENRTSGVNEDVLNREEENVLSVKHDTSAFGLDFHDERDTYPRKNPKLNGREAGESHLIKQSSAESSEVTDLASIRITVSSLTKRLKALEADRRFLEHAINSLRNGDQGVQFIREIASHLQELRMIAMRKDQLVA